MCRRGWTTAGPTRGDPHVRLGLNWRPVHDRDDLEAALPTIDRHGIGTVSPPGELADWSVERCADYGELLREYGLSVGEIGYWQNLLDPVEQGTHVEAVRGLLRRADAMRADCVVTLPGSFADGSLAPHPNNFDEDARGAVRENCRQILDGLELEHTRYALEPWPNTFFHEPEAIRSFLDSVDDARLGVHFDVMNMHSRETYFGSTRLIDRAFDLLADDAESVHAKDLHWDPEHMFVRLDEVPPGEGVIDYDRFVSRLDELPPDTAVFTEHWDDDATFESAIEYLRTVAEHNGITPVERG